MSILSTLAGEYGGALGSLSGALGLSGVSGWEIVDLQSPVGVQVQQTQRWHENFVLVSPSLAQARAWLPLLSEMGKARTFVLLLKDREGESQQASPTSGQLSARNGNEGTPAPEGYSAVRVSGEKWIDVHSGLLAALLRHRVGRRILPLGGIRVGLTDPSQGAWTCGDGQARLLSDKMLEPDETDIFPADYVLASGSLEITSTRQPAGIIDLTSGKEDASGWSVSIPPVDTAVISPAGFLPYPRQGIAVAETRTGGQVLIRAAAGGKVLAVLPNGTGLGETLIDALRDYSYLDVSGLGSGTMGSLEAASMLASFAVAGVPILNVGSVDGGKLLGREVLNAMDNFDTADVAVIRESKSIDMRRTALDFFSPSSRWRKWTANFGRSLPEPELVSVVLATRRPDRIRSAVNQIARQSWPNVEIVVVLHGVELPEGTLSLLTDCGRPVTVRRIPGERVLGDVLNAGVEAASGQLIAKMDDDDWYGEHHLRDLVRAKEYSGAHLVGNQVEFVYLEDLDLVTRRPPEGERFTNHVAGGTMMISAADLADLGGWRPVHRAVDRCLLQAVQGSGGSIYRGHGQNYMMHRYSESILHGGHTWAPDKEVFLQNAVEQWNGFFLPPQIDRTGAEYHSAGRTPALCSVFSDSHDRAKQ